MKIEKAAQLLIEFYSFRFHDNMVSILELCMYRWLERQDKFGRCSACMKMFLTTVT
jgi:hypothetical protein